MSQSHSLCARFQNWVSENIRMMNSNGFGCQGGHLKYERKVCVGNKIRFSILWCPSLCTWGQRVIKNHSFNAFRARVMVVVVVFSFLFYLYFFSFKCARVSGEKKTEENIRVKFVNIA